ncbi:MAG: hypothetical protein FJX75_06380 [Armatimonadetes bacterium]|nr:hypothetical protein [Armatimonadota bacterium]
MSPRSLMVSLMLVAAALVGPFAGTALAAHAHSGTSLGCSSCHVMHGQRNDGAEKFNNGDGYEHLLVAGSINETCLYCHNGKSSYPDVVASGASTDMIPVAADKNTSGGQSTEYLGDPYGASAGCFLSDWTATTNSKFEHDLALAAAAQAPQNGWTSPATGMTCGSCHEVHGNLNWRNLKLRPNGTTDINITENEAGADVQMDTAKSGKSQKRTDAIAFNEGNDLSNWCIDCHRNLNSSITTKHPVDRSLAEAAAANVDRANWTATSGWGFGTTIDPESTGTEYGIPRVRFAQTGNSFSACTTVAEANEVMCLTCHKAHGSRYDSLLVWPYVRYSSASPPYSSIDRNAACQQCHNRGVHS